MYSGGVKKNDFGHDIYDGKGTIFDQEGELLFEGEFVNHMKQGNGIMYLKGQIIYQGEFIQNKKQGHGILYKDGKVYYDGHFRNDLMDGYGVLYYEEDVIAPFKDLREQYPHLNRPQFEGDFVHGMKKARVYNITLVVFYSTKVILCGTICRGQGSCIMFQKRLLQ